MRVFEILSLNFAILALMQQLLIPRKKTSKNLLVAALIGALAIHLAREGLRWQMAVVYGLALLQLLIVFVEIAFKKKLAWHRWTSGVFLSLLVLTGVLLYIFPVNTYPQPAGPYSVGTRTLDIRDETRQELYGERKGQERKFRIQLWYPSVDEHLIEDDYDLAKWNEDGLVVPRGILDVYKMPYFLMDHTIYIKSHSYINAPINKQVSQMPVVIISHGWTGFRNLHTDLAEMFASWGYLAISIDHAYGSVGMVFENGQDIHLDPQALPDRGANSNFDQYAYNLVDTYAMDSRMVLDVIGELNNGRIIDSVLDVGDSGLDLEPDLFKGLLDLDSIGLIGHSTGGGGVVKLALEDNRVKAVFGLDPWVEPIGQEELGKGLAMPALFFRSSQWAGGINDDYVKTLVANKKNDLNIYEIAGSKHQDFTMMYIYGPVTKLLGLSGDLDGYESAAIQQDFIYQFMDQVLRDGDHEYRKLVDDYDMVSEVDHHLGDE